MVKKALKISGILPSTKSFKLGVRHVAGKEDVHIYVANGRNQDILAYESVNDTGVEILTKQQAKNLIASWNLPATGICPHCGQQYNITPPDVDDHL